MMMNKKIIMWVSGALTLGVGLAIFRDIIMFRLPFIDLLDFTILFISGLLLMIESKLVQSIIKMEDLNVKSK